MVPPTFRTPPTLINITKSISHRCAQRFTGDLVTLVINISQHSHTGEEWNMLYGLVIWSLWVLFFLIYSIQIFYNGSYTYIQTCRGTVGDQGEFCSQIQGLQGSHPFWSHSVPVRSASAYLDDATSLVTWEFIMDALGPSKWKGHKMSPRPSASSWPALWLSWNKA